MVAKRFALGFGIAIIFPFLIHYGVSLFVPYPDWKDYRIEDFHQQFTACETKVEKNALRDKEDKLREEYQQKQEKFQKALFFISVPLGIMAIIIGAFLAVQAIGTGLMFGGIFSIFNGYLNFWDHLGDLLRFISLLVAFLVLLWVGYKKLEKK